jgi:molybdopterin-guanine dinucleotide biosynthesis protein A
VGVVLAGGASRRMGRDKATLVLGGRTLAARAADLLHPVCEEVVVADRGRGLVAGRPSLADGPGEGPAAALLGAAAARPGRELLVLACDLPAVPQDLLAALARPSAADCTVTRSRRGIEPLVARYGPAALAALARRVAAGELSVRRLLEDPGLVVEVVEGAALERFGDPDEIFRNLNTPEDLDGLE